MARKEKTHSPGKRDAIAIAGGVWAVSLAVYVATLSPSVTAEDSGELATAAYTLGVPHPPGFPLWCILTKLFTLLPFDNVAYTTNLASAFFGAATAALVSLIILMAMESRLAAVVGGLALAFSQRFWSQSVITEVYTLNTCLLAGTMLCLIIWNRTRNKRWLYGAAAAFGFGMTCHYPLMLLAGPALLTYVLLVDYRGLKDWKLLLKLGGLVLAPLLLYLYLPIRAAAGPPVNWGDPSSWDRFWWHVLRKSYRSLELSESVSLGTKFRFIGHMLGELWWQFTPVLLVPAVIGIVAMWRKQRQLLAMLGGLFLFNTAVLILILHFTFELENRMRVVVYYLPAYVCLAIAIGAGVARTAGSVGPAFRKRKAYAFVGVGLLGVIPLPPLLVHWHKNNRRRDYIARDYASAIFEEVDRDAIVYPSSDYTTFPLLYLQAVEGKRPDVILGDVHGTLSTRVVRKYGRPRGSVRRTEIETRVIRASGRAVYYSEKSQFPRVPGYVLVPEGLLYRVRRTREKSRTSWEPVRLRGMDDASLYKDEMTRGVIATYHRMRAENLFAMGKHKEALVAIDEAASAAANSKEMLNNLGNICAEQGKYKRAKELYRQAVTIWPGYALAHLNLAKVCAATGQPREAAKELAEAVRLKPESPGTRRWLQELIAAASHGQARARTKRGTRSAGIGREELERTKQHSQRAVALDPSDPIPHRNLAEIFERQGDEEKAAYHRSMYRALQAVREVGPRVPPSGRPGPRVPGVPRPPRPGPALPGLPEERRGR